MKERTKIIERIVTRRKRKSERITGRKKKTGKKKGKRENEIRTSIFLLF